MGKLEGKTMYIINIVNIEDEPIVTRSYTEEAFLDRCNDKLHTNYTIEEINKAIRAFLDKYNYLEIHINPLITEKKPVNKYKQALAEIEYYINNQGINNKWNMQIQRFRMDILNIINKVKGGE